MRIIDKLVSIFSSGSSDESRKSQSVEQGHVYSYQKGASTQKWYDVLKDPLETMNQWRKDIQARFNKFEMGPVEKPKERTKTGEGFEFDVAEYFEHNPTAEPPPQAELAQRSDPVDSSGHTNAAYEEFYRRNKPLPKPPVRPPAAPVKSSSAPSVLQSNAVSPKPLDLPARNIRVNTVGISALRRDTQGVSERRRAMSDTQVAALENKIKESGKATYDDLIVLLREKDVVEWNLWSNLQILRGQFAQTDQKSLEVLRKEIEAVLKHQNLKHINAKPILEKIDAYLASLK